MQHNGPTTHTQSPVVTGTSVLGLKFKDGVIIAADNLGSFSHMSEQASTTNRLTLPPRVC